LKILREICVNQISPHYDKQITKFECPQLLYYEPGGHYHAHADADHCDKRTGVWQRRTQRDYTILLFLNDDYEGGQLEFGNFGIRISPSAGDLVCFPSDFHHAHEAKAVVNGNRVCIVTWVVGARSAPATHRSERAPGYFKVC